MFRLHARARPYGMRTELLLALCIAQELYRENAEPFTITSIMDGRHMRGSLHYVGAAADIRLPKRHPTMITRELAKRLGADYDVVLEKTHIHIEYQPKGTYKADATTVKRGTAGAAK